MKKFRNASYLITIDITPLYMGKRYFDESYAINNNEINEFMLRIP